MRNQLEEELGWKFIIAGNEKIGKFLGFTPEIEYSVGSEELGSYVFTPKNCVEWSMSAGEQKIECDKWLKNQREKYPTSEFSHPSYEALRKEWYPNFHLDWNLQNEATKRLLGLPTMISPDINENWKRIYELCSTDTIEPKEKPIHKEKKMVFVVIDTLEIELHGCFDSLVKAKQFAAGMAFCTIKPIEVK